MKILILTALPQEYSPLIKRLHFRRLVAEKPIKKFSCRMPDKEIILIEGGMGKESAREALQHQFLEFIPDLLIFSGFAGGLHKDLPVGVVCFAERVRSIYSEVTLHFSVPKQISDFLDQNKIKPVLTLSGKTAEDKEALSELAGGHMAVLDMETSTVARIAVDNHIPFICLRAVSDGLYDKLGFNLNDISDGRGRIRLGGVLSTVIKRPSTLRAFYLSWRRSRIAAMNLCGSLAGFLSLSANLIRKTISEITVETSCG